MVKLQGTIIGSNVALPAKHVGGFYSPIADPACTARHHDNSKPPFIPFGERREPFLCQQLIQTRVSSGKA